MKCCVQEEMIQPGRGMWLVGGAQIVAECGASPVLKIPTGCAVSIFLRTTEKVEQPSKAPNWI